MSVISMKNVSKTYTNYEKEKGIKGSLTNIFKKKYLYKEAVKDVNLSIEQGSFIGFVGLNGAGKSTTLKMLSGILNPTGGKIEVLGHNPFEKKHEFLRQISMVMGNKSQLWWDIPAIDSFELNRQIFEVEKKKYDKVLEELVEALNVRHLLNIQVRRLSLGERMKMELISALIHSPSVVFLDEPTIGLDVISQYNIRQFLKNYNTEHKSTIILTSHNLDDISYLCERLVIIDKGSLIFDKIYDEFIKEFTGKKIFTIKVKEDSLDILNNVKTYNYDIIDEQHDGLKLSVNEEEIISLTNELTTKYFTQIKDINIENVEIEEIIRDIYS